MDSGDPDISGWINILRVRIVWREVRKWRFPQGWVRVEYRFLGYHTVPQCTALPSYIALNIYITRYSSFAALQTPPSAGGTGPWSQDRHQLFRQYGPTVHIRIVVWERASHIITPTHFDKLSILFLWKSNIGIKFTLLGIYWILFSFCKNEVKCCRTLQSLLRRSNSVVAFNIHVARWRQ